MLAIANVMVTTQGDAVLESEGWKFQAGSFWSLLDDLFQEVDPAPWEDVLIQALEDGEQFAVWTR